MNGNKKRRPGAAHRNGQEMQNISKICTFIVHKLPHFVQQLVIAAGACGLGLAVGTALPPLLGLTGWRPGLTLAGLGLLAIGCAVEVTGG